MLSQLQIVEDPLRDFLISIVALEIGLMLFFLHRKKPNWKNFLNSMTMLGLIMAPVSLTIPILVQYQGWMYYFPLIYLVGLNLWLFFAKYKIYGKTI
jgi:hypothetical protein